MRNVGGFSLPLLNQTADIMAKEDRYVLQQSKESPGWWLLTDTKYGIVIKFEEHRYNGEKKITFLNENFETSVKPAKIAKLLAKMADYIQFNHSHIAMPIKDFEFKEEDGKVFLYCYRAPKLKIELVDCTEQSILDLPAALDDAREFAEYYMVNAISEKHAIDDKLAEILKEYQKQHPEDDEPF